jgi:hypothetical protein
VTVDRNISTVRFYFIDYVRISVILVNCVMLFTLLFIFACTLLLLFFLKIKRGRVTHKSKKNYIINCIFLGIQVSIKLSKRNLEISLGWVFLTWILKESKKKLKLANQSALRFLSRQVWLTCTCQFNFKRFCIWHKFFESFATYSYRLWKCCL